MAQRLDRDPARRARHARARPRSRIVQRDGATSPATTGSGNASCNVGMQSSWQTSQSTRREVQHVARLQRRRRRDAHRQQDLLRVAVVRERSDGDLLGMRPDDRAGGRPVGQRPAYRRRETRVAGVRPVDVPAVLEGEADAGVERLARAHRVGVGDQRHRHAALDGPARGGARPGRQDGAEKKDHEAHGSPNGAPRGARCCAHGGEASRQSATPRPAGPRMTLHTTTGRWRLGATLACTTMLVWGTLPLALKIVLRVLDCPPSSGSRMSVSALLIGGLLAWRRRSAAAAHADAPRWCCC